MVFDSLTSRLNRTHVIALSIILLSGLIGSLVSGPTMLENQQTTSFNREKLMVRDAAYPTASGGAGDSTTSLDSRLKAVRWSYSLDVDNVRTSIDAITQKTESMNGFVDYSRFDSNRGDSGSLRVRVPANRSDVFNSYLEQNFEVESASKNTDDVTDQHTELKLELQNKRAELNRLEELVNKTDEIESVIKAEERMSELRSRIQYLENRMNDLNKRIEYTEYYISLEGPEEFSSDFEIRESFQNAYEAVFSSINLIIVGLGYLLPFGLLGYGVYFALKKLGLFFRDE